MKQEMIHTIALRFQKLSGCAWCAMVSLGIIVIWAIGATCPVLAQSSDQQTFRSAAEASKSLFQAVQANDGELIVKVLGGPTELASSGDKNQDKLDRECFVQHYQEMHRMVREGDGRVILYIGGENWPFPIPLLEKDGVWRFDPNAGMQEILYRRIGENELTAIATCHEFAGRDHDSGKAAIPADGFAASLEARAAGNPVLFHGYYFRVLITRSTNGTLLEKKGRTAGGFTLIAYPAEYRSSGVMTFVVTANDLVYEKDLGVSTSTLAGAITAFHKDATWHAAR
jgi:hypothetical protein